MKTFSDKKTETSSVAIANNSSTKNIASIKQKQPGEAHTVQRVIHYTANSLPEDVLRRFVQHIRDYASSNLISDFENKEGFSLTIDDKVLSDNAAHLGMTLVGLDLEKEGQKFVVGVSMNGFVPPEDVAANTLVKLKGIRVAVSLFTQKRKLEFARNQATGNMDKISTIPVDVDVQEALSTLFHEFNRHVVPNYRVYLDLKKSYKENDIQYGTIEAAFTGSTDTTKEHASSELMTDQIGTALKFLKDKNPSADARRRLLFTTAYDMFLHHISLDSVIGKYMKAFQHREGFDNLFMEFADYSKKLSTGVPAHIKKSTTGINVNDNVLVTNGNHRGSLGKVLKEIPEAAQLKSVNYTRFAYIITVNGEDVQFTNAEFMVI